MALVTTTALCLRKLDFSETSQILSLLTDKLGTVAVIAKGVKRPKSSTGGPLDVMCLYEVVLYDKAKRGVLSILAQAQLMDFFPWLRRRYKAFYAAESLRELLMSIEVDAHDAPPILILAVKALRDLKDPGGENRALATFSYGLLRALGTEPVLTHCIVTGREPSGKRAVSFSVDEMGLVSSPHDQGRKDIVRIGPQTLRALLALARGSGAPDMPVDGWRGAFTLLAWLVARQGGRKLKAAPKLDTSRVL
ncbi:MAG: DNA repair protein RecO [Planctomycetes bacterium]|nr:DNA repair protein RecO [Planctomycetota bacterium]